MAIGIKPGDEVGIPGFTFVATPSAVILAGAKPILIEVDEYLNLDVNDLKKKYNPRMKALIPVHMRGAASDMEAIMEFASSKCLGVVEDAVPAMGVKFKNKYLGTWGHVGAFSTQSDKGCNTGEGGFLIANDDEIFAKAVVLSGAYESRWKKHFNSANLEFDDSLYPIFSFRMDNLRGALAYSQMKKLPERIKKLLKNYEYIVKKLSGFSEISVRKTLEPKSIAGDSLLFYLNDFSIQKITDFSYQLQQEGIECSALGNPNKINIRRFWDWNFLFNGVPMGERRKLLPNTCRYLEKTIDIPLSVTLQKNDLDDLIDAISAVIGKIHANKDMKHAIHEMCNNKFIAFH